MVIASVVVGWYVAACLPASAGACSGRRASLRCAQLLCVWGWALRSLHSFAQTYLQVRDDGVRGSR